ncbi:MAG: DUF3108 domain-containing protein, partial [Blastocatellia bacterium]|nr:DUF3108 domain-containing protein [Blastocatellia bacterium]
LVIVATFFFCLMPVRALDSQHQSPDTTTTKTTAKEAKTVYNFKNGEQLTYAVKWRDLRAAKVLLLTEQLSEKESLPANPYKVEVKIETVGVAKNLVEVRDSYVAYLNPETRFPYRAERDIVEGFKKEKGSVTYDQEKLVVVNENKDSFTLIDRSHDLASILWAIRAMDLKQGNTDKFEGFNTVEKKPFTTHVEVGKREEISTTAGTFSAVELIIKMQEGKKGITDPYSIRIWLTDDEKRIPVLITAQPPFGQIKMELISSGDEEDEE